MNESQLTFSLLYSKMSMVYTASWIICAKPRVIWISNEPLFGHFFVYFKIYWSFWYKVICAESSKLLEKDLVLEPIGIRSMLDTRGKGSLSSMLERPYSVYSGSPLSETRLRALLLRKAAVSSVLRDVFSFPFFSFLGIFVNVIDNI